MASRVTVVLHGDAILRVNLDAALPHVRAIAKSTAEYATIMAPRRSGRLARAISATSGGPVEGGASAKVKINSRIAPHARFVIEGTSVITARSGGLLLLRDKSSAVRPWGRRGGVVIAAARAVQGQRANPFLERALDRAMRERGH